MLSFDWKLQILTHLFELKKETFFCKYILSFIKVVYSFRFYIYFWTMLVLYVDKFSISYFYDFVYILLVYSTCRSYARVKYIILKTLILFSSFSRPLYIGKNT